QEIAVRRALGAGSTRVFRMLILQSVAVVTAGGVLGAGAAWLAMPFLRGLDINPTLTTFTSRIELDATVLFISGAVAVVAGLAAAVLPAWFNRREDLSGMLRENSRSVSLSRAVLRWQQGMVFAQAALSVVILAAAALLGVSLRNITHVEPGFDARGLVVARVQLPDAAYAAHDARAALGRTLLDNLSREPGIGDASFSTTLPVSDVQWGARFLPEMSDGSMGTDQLLLHFRRVSPTYVAQMKIPLVAGRQLTAQDNATSLPVAMISRVLAERLWPGGKAIGKHLYRVNTTPPQPLEIVGIVGDVMDAGFTAPPGDAIYIPFEQLSSTRMSIVVRPRGPASAAIAGIRHALRASDPALAANGIASLETLVQQANTLPRLQSLLLMTFALVAIAIAGIGSYGVMSQLVANREREFAMRLVFGAEPRSLGARVFGQSARLAIPGIVLGIGAVVALGSALKPFVFGVTPYSVFVLGAVGAAMGVVAVASTIPSAVRAMRVEIRNTL
ncbi:MAG TPA: FtsX-like permease family protein, partial [Gemmatimonadaceae bacterium]|nr:FtsX-like permease family protein [Gemmatimonadaceae bacterium]